MTLYSQTNNMDATGPNSLHNVTQDYYQAWDTGLQ